MAKADIDFEKELWDAAQPINKKIPTFKNSLTIGPTKALPTRCLSINKPQILHADGTGN